MKAGDHISVSEEHNAFNKRNGLPRFKVQEVLAVLEPGEVPADHGLRGRHYGYLNYGEKRLVMNNSVGSRDGKWIFWPFDHAASCDTLPKGQDAQQGLAGTESGAVPSETSADAQTTEDESGNATSGNPLPVKHGD